MSHAHSRIRSGRSLLGTLLATMLALAFSGMVAMPASATDDVGLQGCLAMFPGGVPGTEAATGAITMWGIDPASVDDIFAHANGGAVSCYDIFGVQPPQPTAVPTEPPTEVPTEPPVEPTKAPVEPTKAPSVEPTKAPAAVSTVAALPITGHGPSDGAGLPAVGLLAGLAALLALAAATVLRFADVRGTRR